jgi:DNA-binding NarL/FixJ family response regulator
MSLRVIFKYGLLGGLFIVMFAFLKSEWFYSGLYPDVFLTFIALVFAASGMFLRHLSLRGKREIPTPDRKEELQLKLRQLSRRELEVLELLNSRHTNKEIADKLNIELSP